MISSSLEGEAGGACFQVEGSEKQRTAGMLPPESGRFFVKRETAIQWFSQWRYHRQIPNVVIAIFSVPASNRVP